jgi:anti-sigma regulatory factor (Ser/Thr protein kinase)
LHDRPPATGDEVTVALSLDAPRTVRHSLEAQYVGSMERSLLDDLTLLASEVVTNAVQHSGRPNGDPLDVQTTVIDGVLRLEVTDRGVGVHELEARSLKPPSGLGYVEILSDRWSSRANGSFQVWLEIDVVSREMTYRAAA